MIYEIWARYPREDALSFRGTVATHNQEAVRQQQLGGFLPYAECELRPQAPAGDERSRPGSEIR